MTKLFGVKIRIHPLLWMVVAASAATGYLLELIILFGVILIHELGHAAAASIFNWRIREIHLLPFGGAAEVDENGSIPAWQELIVVLAGPLQNFLMILVAAACRSLGIWGEEWTTYFIEVNAMIGLFNLIPIHPLDGGKLLGLALSLWLPYYRSLYVVHTVSLLLSSLMVSASLGVWNVYGVDLNMLMIGLFLLVTNWSDYRNITYIFIRFLTGRETRLRAHANKPAQPIVVSAGQTISQVVRLLKRGPYHVIYVCNEHGEIRHVLSELRVIRAYLASYESYRL